MHTPSTSSETFKICFQCGMCSASCPVRRLIDDFNPVKISRTALIEGVDKLIANGEVWLCACCNSCIERCPRGVSLVDFIIELRNKAAREGKIPSSYLKAVKNILQNGWVNDLSEFEFIREEIGLPPPPNADKKALSLFARKTGLDKMIK